MSILIKGMEMPLPGTFNIIYIYSDGQVHMPSWGKGMAPTNGVKAILIPPHGRLIDADALMKEMHNIILEDGEDRRIFYSVIERQPTIIHASEEGE